VALDGRRVIPPQGGRTLGGPVLGVGIDLVEVERMRVALSRTPTLAARLFTEGERAVADRRRDPAQALAARFAAKEAVLKALGVGLSAAPLRTIEVVRDPAGEPSVVLHHAAEALATDRGVAAWALSLTHTAVTAGAVALALGAPMASSSS
jgi:holo-[acyl-carrier protein] synthase